MIFSLLSTAFLKKSLDTHSVSSSAGSIQKALTEGIMCTYMLSQQIEQDMFNIIPSGIIQAYDKHFWVILYVLKNVYSVYDYKSGWKVFRTFRKWKFPEVGTCHLSLSSNIKAVSRNNKLVSYINTGYYTALL